MSTRPASPRSPKVMCARVVPFPASTQRGDAPGPVPPGGAAAAEAPGPVPPGGAAAAEAPDAAAEGSVRAATRLQPPAILIRRAVSLLVLTLVLPGSAHWVAGNRRVAKAALGVTAGCVSLGLILALLAAVDVGAAVGLLADSTVLRTLAVLLVLAGLGEALLLADAWRLGRPASLPRRVRPMIAAGSGLAPPPRPAGPRAGAPRPAAR